MADRRPRARVRRPLDAPDAAMLLHTVRKFISITDYGGYVNETPSQQLARSNGFVVQLADALDAALKEAQESHDDWMRMKEERDTALNNTKSAFDVLEGMKEQVAERDELKRQLRAERKAKEEAERDRDYMHEVHELCEGLRQKKEDAEARGRELASAIAAYLDPPFGYQRRIPSLRDALQRFRDGEES